MAEVLRLDINAKGGIDPDPDGAYVLYSDYAAERERSRKLREALEFYAHSAAWGPSDPHRGLPRVDLDEGEVARAVLQETSEGEA